MKLIIAEMRESIFGKMAKPSDKFILCQVLHSVNGLKIVWVSADGYDSFEACVEEYVALNTAPWESDKELMDGVFAVDVAEIELQTTGESQALIPTDHAIAHRL